MASLSMDDEIDRRLEQQTTARAVPSAPTGAAPPPERTSQAAPAAGTSMDDEIQRRLDAYDRPPELSAITSPSSAPALDAFFARRELPPADDFLARQTGQDRLGAEALTNRVRFDLGMSDTFEEKRTKLLSYHPRGEMVQIPVPEDLQTSEAGNNVILYRTTGEGPFTRLYPFTEPLVERAEDISRLAPPLFGQAVGTLYGRGKGWFFRSITTGAGGTAGEAGRDAVERARGIKTEGYDVTAERAALEFALGTIGSAVGDFIGTIVRPGRLRGWSTVNAASREADLTAKRLGLPRLVAGQLSANPNVARVHQQAIAKAGVGAQDLLRQQDAALAKLATLKNPRAQADVKANLAAYEAQARRLMHDTLRGPGISIEDTVAAFDPTFDAWTKISQSRVHALYEIARARQAPTFDMRSLKAIAQDHLTLAKTGQAEFQYDAETRQLLQRIIEQPDELVDGVVTQTIPGGPRYGPNYPERRLPSTTEPVPSAVTGEPLPIQAEQKLSALRTDIWRLLHPQIGQPLRTDIDKRIARQLQVEAVRTFDKPSNLTKMEPNEAASFASDWNSARKAAEARFKDIEFLETNFLIKTREFQPMVVVEKLMSATTPDDVIRRTRQILIDEKMPERWTAIQLGFRSEMTDMAMRNGPEAAVAALERFRPNTLNLLMSQPDKDAFASTISSLKKLDNLGVQEWVATDASNAATVVGMVARGQKEAISTLLRTATPQLRASIRAGLINELAGATKEAKLLGGLKGTTMLDPEAIDGMLVEWDKNGASKFLEASDISLVRDIAQYAKRSQVGMDISATLAAGEQAGGFTTGHALRSAKSYISSLLLGRLVSSKTGKFLLVGWFPRTLTADIKIDPYIMRGTGAALADLAKRLEEQRKLENRGVVPGQRYYLNRLNGAPQ
jgi:hypothetical protein